MLSNSGEIALFLFTSLTPNALFRRANLDGHDRRRTRGIAEFALHELFDGLWKLVDAEDKNGTYVSGAFIKPPQQVATLNSISVVGIGELRLPLSVEDTSRRRGVYEQAPFGLPTVVDTNIHRWWQFGFFQCELP